MMRNIWTVARKELRGYFDHPTAYILLVVFLAINFFFYFRSAFLVSEASLRPMFDLLPWILLFFVPAVTMGSLAEEKRHGTLEVTLSHPLHEHEFLLGKFVGDVLFIAIALGGTLLVPLLLLLGGKPDFGVVFAQYFGGLLLVAGMTAVGVFASALTRNQITAFIVATAVCFILMMAGTEVVQIGLPAWLQAIVGPLGILPHFAKISGMSSISSRWSRRSSPWPTGCCYAIAWVARGCFTRTCGWAPQRSSPSLSWRTCSAAISPVAST
jgi:ABC-2 type transport system permease protein